MFSPSVSSVGLRTAVPILLVAAAIPSSVAQAGGAGEPLRFFEGRTEMVSFVKVLSRKPYRSHTVGRGQIMGDGSLVLVQHINDAGKPPEQRHWRIRQVGPNRFAGTMSEALGPVNVQRVGGNYRFRFKMKGNLAVEQWVKPLPGGKLAQSKLTVRKFGIKVASSEGTIRKV